MNINHLNEEYFRHWAEETKSFPISGSLIPLSKEANSGTASNNLCANTSTRQRKQIRQHPFSGDPLGSLGPAQSALKLKAKASDITQHSPESRQHQNFNSCCKSNLSCQRTCHSILYQPALFTDIGDGSSQSSLHSKRTRTHQTDKMRTDTVN